MELLSAFAVSLAVFFIIVTLLYYYFTWNFDHWAKQGIPYVNPVPVLGNFQLLGNMRFEEIDMVRYKRYGRTFGIFEGRKPALVVSEPDLLKQLMLKDCFTTFTNHRKLDLAENLKMFDKFLFHLKDEEWKTVRNVMTPTFTSGKLKLMVEQMEVCVGKLIEHVEKFSKNREPIDVVHYFKCYILDVIANCVFGVELNSLENTDSPFIKHSRKLFESSNIAMIIFFVFPRLAKMLGNALFSDEPLHFFEHKVKDIIELRKRNKGGRKCFVDLLLQAQAEDKEIMTEIVIIAQCVSFLAAGLETSSITLSAIAYTLATNDDIQEKLLSEVDELLENNSGKITYNAIQQMPYLDMVISEALRMYPPLVRLERTCSEDDYKLGNATLSKGMTVTIPIHCIHHDEEFYPNPHEFIPERFSAENKTSRNPYTYLPFGTGPRSCIGNRFALMQIKLGLVHVLSKYRFLTCPQTVIPIKFKLSGGELLTPECTNLIMEIRNEC